MTLDKLYKLFEPYPCYLKTVDHIASLVELACALNEMLHVMLRRVRQIIFPVFLQNSENYWSFGEKKKIKRVKKKICPE